MAYDVIGDIHVQAGKRVRLLQLLGYLVIDGVHRHPLGRVAVFVGDLIDRGPAQVEVVRIVRAMVQAGSARVVMCNHEYNAIGFATLGGTGFLRPHLEKNRRQHAGFLRQVGWGTALHREMIAWFRTLPIVLDLGGIRVCHAWWDVAKVAAANDASLGSGALAEDFLRASFDKREPVFVVMEGLTKGLEVRVPGTSTLPTPVARCVARCACGGGTRR